LDEKEEIPKNTLEEHDPTGSNSGKKFPVKQKPLSGSILTVLK